MNKRILITGGCGFIGSHIADRFIKEGWSVTVADDLSGPKNLGNLAENHETFEKVDLHVCDFADNEILKMISDQKFDVVCHQAARPRVSYSVEHPFDTNDVNVNKTIKLLEACRGNVNRVVFASSSSVYGGAEILPTEENQPKDPKSPYALQKSIIEDYLKLFAELYGLDSICLRYFNVFGPRAKGDGAYATAVAAWTHAIKNGTPLRSDGTGEQTRDMCYVENVAEANFLAATKPGKFNSRRYNVACGDRTSNREILNFLKKRFPSIKVIDAPWRAGDVMHTQADISRIETQLGYKVHVRFWDGLEKTLEYMLGKH